MVGDLFTYWTYKTVGHPAGHRCENFARKLRWVPRSGLRMPASRAFFRRA